MMENIIEEMPIIVLPTVRPVPVSISHRCRLRTDVKNLPAGAPLRLSRSLDFLLEDQNRAGQTHHSDENPGRQGQPEVYVFQKFSH